MDVKSTSMLENQVTNDVQKQFLRRTPIKLKQFSRFLVDIAESEVDSLRLKALLSQVTKTRESCLEQEFASTAKILNQLIKQLSMSEESLNSQKPLLIRLAKRLSEHAAKLSQGIKPQSRQIKVKEPKNKTKADKTESKAKPVSGSEFDPSQLRKEQPKKEKVDEPGFVADLSDKELNSIPNTVEEPANKSDKLSNVQDKRADFNYLNLYSENSRIIFLINKEYQNPSQLEHYNALFNQLRTLGIDCIKEDRLQTCIEQSAQQEDTIVIAPLTSAEELKVLDDESVEKRNQPLIFTANEDNQENRLKAIRNQGTGFVIEPISVNCLFDQIGLSFDLNAASPCRILVMEDSKAQARYYEKVLQKGHFEIRVVNDPTILLEAIRGFDPETILMDMQMPDSSGVELTQMIRQMPRYAHLPIIFLSAEENLRKQNQALMSGGTSFIVKPVQKEQLMFMARLYTRKYRSINPQIDVNPDTSVAYPMKFKQVIVSEMARVTRSNVSLALVLIQIDEIEDLIKNAQFSFINNAINQLTQLLKKRLRQTDIIGHIDATSLGVILTSGDKKHWSDVLFGIQEQFANHEFKLDQKPKQLSVSMGISEVKRNFSAHQWLERSNQALEEAIQNGASQINWDV